MPPGGSTTRLRSRRRRRVLCALAGVTIVCALAPPLGATTTTPAGRARLQPAPTEDVGSALALATVVPLETPGIDPVLDGVEVEQRPAVVRAHDRLERTVTDQADATLRWMEVEQRRAKAATTLATSTAQAAEAQRSLTLQVLTQARLEARLRELRGTEDLLAARLGEEQNVLRRMAAELWSSSSADRYERLRTLADWTEADRRGGARDRALDLQSDAVERARRPWVGARADRRRQGDRVRRGRTATAEASARVADTTVERRRVDQVLAATAEQARAARADVDRASEASRDAIVARRAARLEGRVDEIAVPLVALHAYWRASAMAPCAIGWWVLAGIGRVETRHGSAQGARLTPSGDTTTKIRGIPLDGRPGTLAIGDSDGGRLDGDDRWDRAVGPMQFIPGTWNRWAVDGNADGKADPHNIYDATLAAARYLCFSRGRLTEEPEIRGALLAYNRSVAYGSKVMTEGRLYLDALDLPEVGKLPAGADLAPDRDAGG